MTRRGDTIALTKKDFLLAGKPGASPWLGGIDSDDFGGDLVEVASFLGYNAIAPVHGTRRTEPNRPWLRALRDR